MINEEIKLQPGAGETLSERAIRRVSLIGQDQPISVQSSILNAQVPPKQKPPSLQKKKTATKQSIAMFNQDKTQSTGSVINSRNSSTKKKGQMQEDTDMRMQSDFTLPTFAGNAKIGLRDSEDEDDDDNFNHSRNIAVAGKSSYNGANNMTEPGRSRAREDIMDEFDSDQKTQKKLDKLRQGSGPFGNLRPTAHDDNQIGMANLQGGLGDDLNIKRSLELRNGMPVRSPTNFHKNTNAISLNLYKGYTGLLWFVFDLIFTLDHLVLLLNTYFVVASGQRQLNAYSHIIATICLSFMTTALMNILADRKLKEAADSVNKKPVEKYVFTKRMRCFQVFDWASILTGDIIKIKQNQEVPCDCLILDIVGSRGIQQTCYTRAGLMVERNTPVHKRSYQGSIIKHGRNMNSTKFVDQITGLLKWEYNHYGFFSGSFKQADTPTAFEITHENIMQRGSYLQNASHAICIALNVGYQAMGNTYESESNSNKNFFKTFWKRRGNKSHFESVHFTALRYVQLFSLLFCLLPVLLLILEELVLQNTAIHRFVETYSDARVLYTLNSYFELFAELMQNMPYLAKLTMEAVIFFHAYFTMWDINLVPAELNYNDLKIMKSMGQIDSVVCPNNALFIQSSVFVAAFKINDQIYFNQNFKNEKIVIQAERKNDINDTNDDSSNSDDDFREQLDYLPNVVDFDPRFHHPEVHELTKDSNPNSSQFHELLKALVLTHSASITKVDKHKFSGVKEVTVYKSLYKEEEAQLNFASSFDYSFLSRNQKLITIMCSRTQQRYEELFIRRIGADEDLLTISVLRDFINQNQLTIYYRGPLRIIQSLLSMTASKVCRQDIHKFQKQGIHPWGVAKRSIEDEDANEFVRILNENQVSTKIGKRSKNDKLLMSLARDLTLVGIYGLQKDFNYRDTLVTEDLKKNGIKLYLLSNDSEETVLTDINAMNMLEDYDTPLQVTGITDRQVEESIKECLKECVKRRLRVSQIVKEKNIYSKSKLTKSKKQNKSKMNKAVNKENQESENDHPKKKKKYRDRDREEKNQDRQNIRNNRKSVDEQLKQNMSDFAKLQQRNVVCFDGQQLQFILMDETLKKLFLTLCNLCSLCVGSRVPPQQRQYMVRAIRQFAIQGKLGNVVSIVAHQSDKFTIEESDISIGLITGIKQSDVLARTDVQMKNLYGLTYLFFKHGTLAHRRSKVVLIEFIQRTVMTQFISLFFFFIKGFSYTLPYGRMFFSFFMAVQTPIQFWMEGITHTDYGFNIMHRIFGEYRFNLMNQLQIQDFVSVFMIGLFDGLIFISCFLFSGVLGWDFQVDVISGNQLSAQSLLILNAISLEIINIYRVRAVRSSIIIFSLSNFVFFFLSLITVLEDENLVGIYALSRCPHALAFIIFLFLSVSLKHVILLIRAVVFPWNFKKIQRYQEIEDRIFMEEYEDPDQEFSIQNLDSFIELVKVLDINNLFSINQNLLSVHRTDSMDLILERLNFSAQQITDKESNQMNSNVSSYINKCTLRLHDINKELEYTQSRSSIKYIEANVPILWTSVFLFTFLFIFKIVNSYLEINGYVKDDSTITTTVSNTVGSSVATSYYEGIQIILLLFSLYLIKRVKIWRLDLLIYTLIIIMNCMCIIKFYVDRSSPLIQIQFLFVLAFSFAVRLSSVLMVSIVCIISVVAFMQIKFSVMQDQTESIFEENLQLIWMSLSLIIYVAMWIYYAYWDEIRLKVQFVQQFRQVKEFQKLKGIVNILNSSISGKRTGQGKKNYSDLHQEISVVIIDIEDFSNLTQTYSCKELVQLLDKLYEGFDALCEQYSVLKIQSVGKSYWACSGIKQYEKDIDPRLLTNHHSVRIIDFACAAQQLTNTIQLKDGKTLKVQIGIHIGPVLSGIVGEIKPQFSLLGETMQKTKKIGIQCQAGKILISQQLQKFVFNKMSNYMFHKSEMITDGETETLFYVQKRKRQYTRMNNKLGIKAQERKKTVKEAYDDTKSLNGDEQGHDKFASSNEGDMSARSFISSQGHHSERNMLVEQDLSDEEQHSQDRSLEDSFNKLKFEDVKDDKQIVKIAAQNDRYKLVERPRFLLNFESREWEGQFTETQFKKYFSQEVCNLITKGLLDTAIVQGVIYSRGVQDLSVYLLVLVFMVLLIGFSVISLIRMNKKHVGIAIVFWYIMTLCFLIIFILLGPLYGQLFNREQELVTFALMYMAIFNCRTWQFRTIISLTVIMFSAQMFQSFFHIKLLHTNVQTYIADSCLLIIYGILYAFVCYFREMQSRKVYNNDRIVSVEIKKTEDSLQKMVPEHVLAGIKNDHKVYDYYSNMSILDAQITGLTELIKKQIVKPQDVIALLSRIFAKFDNLCEQHNVYKVHTVQDNYIVMGFTGKILKEKRNLEESVIEGYNLLELAFSMMDIIAEEREKSRLPGLKNIHVQLGIHTGKIYGGIIGSKQIRYDIFGPDMLITKMIQLKGNEDSINVSESFHDLLKKKGFIYDTFEWEDQDYVEIPGLQQKYKSYRVGQIFANEGSSSDDPFHGQEINSNGKRRQNEINSPSMKDQLKAMIGKDHKPAQASRVAGSQHK